MNKSYPTPTHSYANPTKWQRWKQFRERNFCFFFGDFFTMFKILSIKWNSLLLLFDGFFLLFLIFVIEITLFKILRKSTINRISTSFNTTWKVSKYGVVSGPYFSVFWLNTGKYGPEITPYLATFHAVKVSANLFST